MAETNREKVSREISDTCTKILTRAMGDSGMCCAKGAPLCAECTKIVECLKRDLYNGTMKAFSQEAIDRLATAPEGMIEEIIRKSVEPAFRASIAKGLLS